MNMDGFIDKDGNLCRGQVNEQGQLHGPCRWTTKNDGCTKEGTFVNGLMQGLVRLSKKYLEY